MSPPRSTRRRPRRQATRARGVPFSYMCLHLPYAGPNALLAAGFPDVDRTIEGGVVHRVAGTYPIQTAAEIFGRLLEDVGLLPVDAAVEDADVDVEASAPLERRAGVADPRPPPGDRRGDERRLVPLAAMRRGREVRGVGLEQHAILGHAARGIAEVAVRRERQRAREGEVEAEAEPLAHFVGALAVAMHLTARRGRLGDDR